MSKKKAKVSKEKLKKRLEKSNQPNTELGKEIRNEVKIQINSEKNKKPHKTLKISTNTYDICGKKEEVSNKLGVFKSELLEIGLEAQSKINKNTIEIIEYSMEYCEEYRINDIKSFDFSSLADIKEGTVKWINIDEQYTEEILNEIKEVFHIHPLTIENIVNDRPRAKVEDYDEYLYIAAKMIYYSKSQLIVEHMNCILGKNYVLTFGEVRGDVFDPIRNRLRNQGTRQRKNGADYLMYTILDAIVDGYYEVLDIIGEKIDAIEEELIENSSQECLHEIRSVKKELLYIYKYFGPLREVISWVGKESSDLISEKTILYFRDVYDHIVQVIDITETYRELLAGLMELHISNNGNRLNEIMKVLTIISTIFIPLTFIAGIYGMNFKYMPELGFKWGYGVTWLVMIIISTIMVYYFKKKKWF